MSLQEQIDVFIHKKPFAKKVRVMETKKRVRTFDDPNKPPIVTSQHIDKTIPLENINSTRDLLSFQPAPAPALKPLPAPAPLPTLTLAPVPKPLPILTSPTSSSSMSPIFAPAPKKSRIFTPPSPPYLKAPEYCEDETCSNFCPRKSYAPIPPMSFADPQNALYARYGYADYARY
jgi:hypothetical protein